MRKERDTAAKGQFSGTSSLNNVNMFGWAPNKAGTRKPLVEFFSGFWE